MRISEEMEERAEQERQAENQRKKQGFIQGTKFRINTKFPELPYQILK
jgi:hypothetical protein